MPPLVSTAARAAIAFALAALFAAAAQSSPALAEPPAPGFVPGEVILRLEPGATFGATVAGAAVQDRSFDGGQVTVSVPPGSELQYAHSLGAADGVEYAELNYLKQPSYVPNDPTYPLQWSFPMIEAEQAWDYARGEGVTVAVVDTGVAFEDYGPFGRSPQLARTLFVSPYDATTGSNHPNDENGHGTHVTGTIAQDSDDGLGTAGLAPAAAIMPVKVCQPHGCGADDLAEGIRWAVDHGADVINISLGGGTVTRVERDALEHAEAHGVVVVAAAGNGGGDFIGDGRIDYPAAVPTVVSVGAVDTQKEITRYSNYGVAEAGNLHVVAPGGNIRADLNSDGYPDGVLQNTYAHTCGGPVVDYRAFNDCFYHGTSMATPHVTGLVALILSEYPALSPERVRAALRCGAQDLGALGEDPVYGAGLVQAVKIFRDADSDGIPNCAELPPRLDIWAGEITVEPGTEFSVAVNAYTPDGVRSYVAHLAYNASLVQFVSCQAREGAICTTTPSQVHIESATGEPEHSTFGLGYVTFRAIGPPGSTSLLVVAGEADAVSPSDPHTVATAHHGRVTIREAPETVAGDANCDGSVTSSDVPVALALVVATAETLCAGYVDVNCTGAADAGDILALLEFLAAIDPVLPSGCPSIGQPSPWPA